MGDSEEAACHSLSTHKPDNLEEKETALFLKMWVSLGVGPVAEQNMKHKLFCPALLWACGAVLAISRERAASHISGLPVSG